MDPTSPATATSYSTPASAGAGAATATAAASTNAVPKVNAAAVTQRVASDPLQAIARSDPNNIFNALTRRLVELELNQTLINNWLTMWQGQIAARFKALNATNEEAAKRMRGVQANVSATQVGIQEARADVALVVNRTIEADEAVGVARAVRTLEARIEQMSADAYSREAASRREISRLQASHRIELLGCMLFSLALSWVAATRCLTRHAPRRVTGNGAPSRNRYELTEESGASLQEDSLSSHAASPLLSPIASTTASPTTSIAPSVAPSSAWRPLPTRCAQP